VHLHEGRSLALERKAPIPAPVWACLMQFRAEINQFNVSSPAETRRSMNERRVATVDSRYLDTVLALQESNRRAC
jgi:hypothetical protein